MKLTKTTVDKASPPKDKDQIFYRDDQLKGFALRVTKNGVKSFVVETSIGNKVRRITIAKYGKLTVEEARIEAKSLLGNIAKGGDPVAEKKAKRTKQITLQQVFDDYLVARKSLKATTALDYKRVLNCVMPDWLNKPLINITRDMVAKRHRQYGETRSKARANFAMRLLRSLFNFAINEYQTSDGKEIILENPVKRISHTRAWYRIERRKTIIKNHQLADWYKGLMNLSECKTFDEPQMWQDYFLLVLLTGLRRNEALSLRWSQVDLQAKIFTIEDTKNKEQHTLPMSDFLFELFSRRKLNSNDEFVFPAKSKTGHAIEPRKAMLKVIELSGVNFTIHDLRRTFITAAESLEISAYALKRLLNHKMTNDVTSGYIITDVERLRRPMQQITDYLLRCMGVKRSAEVIDIKSSKTTVSA